MDSANLDEKKVAELIDEKMKDLQIRREKIFPYPVEEIKFLEILQSKLDTDILWHTNTSYWHYSKMITIT